MSKREKPQKEKKPTKTYQFRLYRATRLLQTMINGGRAAVFFLKDTDNCFSDERRNSSPIR
ncbi:hypothetical protein Krac_11716 [Ktedonobacter racemifer DSM 44963]|uniref:Uncharacterized protein n=1 Tax=Ktedonobacter racemifer DSM 44963 TaxID=485913 RepID=D6TD57_KTERA|nr:hypothetical protein Krac_11716 [Ktedonobacter racemifer DSM 44963]